MSVDWTRSRRLEADKIARVAAGGPSTPAQWRSDADVSKLRGNVLAS